MANAQARMTIGEIRSALCPTWVSWHVRQERCRSAVCPVGEVIQMTGCVMLRNDLLDLAMDEHARWLRSVDGARNARFLLLRKHNREGAAAEALVGAWLRSQVDNVEAFEDPGHGGPDFRCTHRNQRFYVEVTALATKAVENASWIPDTPRWQGGAVGSISQIVRSSVSDKVHQCANRDAPVLIALGIHHSWVSMDVGALVRSLLISDNTYIPAVSPDSPIPTEPGGFVTQLRNALFIAVNAGQVISRRQPVSGVLVFGLGVQPLNVMGVINGAARRRFDPQLLPQVEFAKAVVKGHRVGIRQLKQRRQADRHGTVDARRAVDMAIARSLLNDRIKRGWAQTELARRSGVRLETISRIEAAKHIPRQETLLKLDRALAAAPHKAM